MADKIRPGITEKKKAELDALTREILQAQYDVEQFQSVVTSLTQKSIACQQVLAYSDDRRGQCHTLKDLMDQLLQTFLNTKDGAHIAYNETNLACTKTKAMATQIKLVVDKLIYSAEKINKLANVLIRKKALNPLISDDLVARVVTAGKDANNAVALTLIAFKSAFTARASIMELEVLTGFLDLQSSALYENISADTTGKPEAGKHLTDQISHAYEQAKLQYEQAQHAVSETTNQVNTAQGLLSTAQLKLRSLQAALAAGNAAALAS